MATAQGDIRKVKIKNDNKARVVVAGASRGYPGDYSDATGKQIFGIEEVLKMDGVRFYSAGVKKRGRNYYTNGGRLFYMVGEGKDVVEARQKAYEAMSTIFVEGNNLHYRTDIGWRDVERAQNR